MAIGTPVLIGAAGTGSAGTTIAATTTAAAAAGQLIAVPVISSGSSAIVSVTDSASNTYTAGTIQLSSGVRLGMYYSVLTNGLPLGGTVTLEVAAATGNKGLMVVLVDNPLTPDPFDRYDQATPLTGTVISMTTGTFGSADAVVLSPTFINTGSDTWVEDPPFTELGTGIQANSARLRCSYHMLSSTAPVTRTGTNSASRFMMMNSMAFKGAGGTPPVGVINTSNTLLLGVG